MLQWLWAGFALFVGVGMGFYICSWLMAAKIADLQAEIHTLVLENEHWAQERQKQGAMG